MIHELQAGVPRPFGDAGGSRDERVLAARARARRRWVIRTALLLLLTAATLVILVMLRRDRMAMAEQLGRLELARSALQEKIKTFGTLPSAVPELKHCYYASNEERFYAMNTQEPVIIAYTPMVPLLLRSNGRAVLIAENGKVHAEWRPESEFRSAWWSQQERIAAFEEKLRARPPELP